MPQYLVLSEVWGDSDYDNVLIHGVSDGRPGRLPRVRGQDQFDCEPLRVGLPAHLVEHTQLEYSEAVSDLRFREIRDAIAASLPAEDRELLLGGAPGQQFGLLGVSRIGGYVPPISFPGMVRVDGPVVSRRVAQALKSSGIRGFDLHPIVVKRAVRLQWRPGDPLPGDFLGEPERLLLNRPHDALLAEQIESDLCELVPVPLDWCRPYEQGMVRFESAKRGHTFQWLPDDVKDVGIFSWGGIVIVSDRAASIIRPLMDEAAVSLCPLIEK